MKGLEALKNELPRIVDFIREYVHENENIVVPVSGGLDSDVVARLCAIALGKDRVRLFVVHQPGMELRYIENARNLARDLDVSLAVIEVGNMNRHLICCLKDADPQVGFDPNSLLDPSRANCSLRTAILSSYQDKGYIIAANTNRTETELGFFMPFGDNLGHIKPISHLYKTEVRLLAELIGSRQEVIAQEPSAGFWEGENDLEDIAFWLYNGGPVSNSKQFSDEDVCEVMRIKEMLSMSKIDMCLESNQGGLCPEQIAERASLPVAIVERIIHTVRSAGKIKRRKLMVCLER